MDAEQAREETIRAYQLHASSLLAYAHRLTRDSALAQDTVQEIFLRLFLALMQDEEIRNARAWLHRVAHNYICETTRSAAVRTAVSIDDTGEDRLHSTPEMARDWELEWMDGAQAMLAPREWQCVQLRLEGFEYTEIAARMAIRPGTVSALLHRAVGKLRSRLHKKEGAA